jgi:inosine/xanthosine triphosphatase
MKIAIGTKNKAKVGAVEAVIRHYFPNAEFESIDVASDVSVQPFSNAETRQGAINRARNTNMKTNADLSFGLEGGVDELGGIMYCCNWGAVALKDGTIISSSGAQFALPELIAKQLRSGMELGPVMDVYTNTENIRHHQGAIGIFTNGLIDRKEMFEHIVKLLIGQVMFKLKKESNLH